jgi:hypothetical protein
LEPRPAPRAAVRPEVRRIRPAVPTAPTSLFLNEQNVVALSKSGLLTAEFPFFKIGNVYRQTGCKCAAKAVDRARLTAESNRVRGTLRALPPDKLARVKAILGYQTISWTPQGQPKPVVL